MLYLDRIYSKCINILEDIKAYFLLHKKHFDVKILLQFERAQKKSKMMQQNMKKLNGKETKRSNHEK